MSDNLKSAFPALSKTFKYGSRFSSPVNSPAYEWRAIAKVIEEGDETEMRQFRERVREV